jgi:hypothetical protein
MVSLHDKFCDRAQRFGAIVELQQRLLCAAFEITS